MENSNLFSANKSKAGFIGLSGYFKLDSPTGDPKLCSGNSHICRCGRSQNKPFCDESHAKCVNGMIDPWF